MTPEENKAIVRRHIEAMDAGDAEGDRVAVRVTSRATHPGVCRPW